MSNENIKLLNKKELASLLKISLRTLQRYMNLNLVPEPIKIRNNLRWKHSEIQKWIDSGCPKPSQTIGDN